MDFTNPGDRTWGSPPLPPWVEGFRPQQMVAISQVVGHFRSGKKVVFLDAPTGTGKTLIAEAVRRALGEGLSKNHPLSRSLYCCTTKTLQDQFLEDFGYAAVIKGRTNYPTVDRPELWPDKITAADCDLHKVEAAAYPTCSKCPDIADMEAQEGSSPEEDEDYWHCSWCHPTKRCPYVEARDQALYDAPVAVANTAYLLAEWNGPGRFSGWVESVGQTSDLFGLVVVDEADTLESSLMGWAEFSVTRRQALRYRIGQPDVKTHTAKGAPAAWCSWADATLDNLKARARVLAAKVPDTPTVERAEALREQRQVERLRDRLAKVRDELGEGGWVYTSTDPNDEGVTFKPIRVDRIARDAIWRHANRFLLMSATVISPEIMAHDLGLRPDEWASVAVGSDFPPERRPIIVSPVASMTNSQKETAWPQMADGIRDLMERYPDERILVHTVSYHLAGYLHGRLGPRAYTYRSARERDDVIEQWLRSHSGVLLASSLERGIDLVGEACRVVIVAKIPFPYLGDRQVSARLHTEGGQPWYAMLAVRSLIQQTGRAMRRADDWCDIWVLDEQFRSNVWSKWRHLLPSWWVEALQWYPGRVENGRVRHGGEAGELERAGSVPGDA